MVDHQATDFECINSYIIIHVQSFHATYNATYNNIMVTPHFLSMGSHTSQVIEYVL